MTEAAHRMCAHLSEKRHQNVTYSRYNTRMSEDDISYSAYVAEAILVDIIAIYMHKHRTEMGQPHSIAWQHLKTVELDSPHYEETLGVIESLVEAALPSDDDPSNYKLPTLLRRRLAHQISVYAKDHVLPCDEAYIFNRLGVLENQMTKQLNANHPSERIP